MSENQQWFFDQLKKTGSKIRGEKPKTRERRKPLTARRQSTLCQQRQKLCQLRSLEVWRI
jgi:hypothetical protein